MKRGKKICNSLREVRRQIAAANDIPYETTDCHFEGECRGTCPKCESELRYIENQLSLRRAAGKAVSLVGLSLGISAAWAANDAPNVPVSSADTVPVVDLADDGDFETGEESEPNQVFTVVEVQPEFPGGEDSLMNFIKKNLKYPYSGIAGEIGIQGRVTLSFTIEKDGAITNIEVMRSPAEELSQEAIRVVKSMPKWKPGTQLGKPVRTKYVLPITFRLEDTPKSDTLAIKEETPSDNGVLAGLVEQQPEFLGGEAAMMAFIKKNVKYPESAARDSIEGRVTLCFMVNKDGTITDIEVMRSPDERLSQEAIRVVKLMPKWRPGRQVGKPVDVKYVLPVTFRLSDKPKNVAK